MNLRVIKKEIEYCLGAFIDDCTLFVALNPSCDTESVNGIAEEAVELYNSLRDKVNNLPEELRHKTSPKHQHREKTEIAAERADLRKKLNAYYDGIRKEMIEKLDELNGKLSDAITNKAPKKPVETAEKPAKKAPAKKTAPKAAKAGDAPAEAAEKAPAKKAAPKADGEKPAAKKTSAKKAAPKASKAEDAPAEDAEKPAKKPAAKKAAPKKEEK